MPKKDQLQNWAVVSKIGQFSHGTVLKFMLLKDLILDTLAEKLISNYVG